MEKTKEEILKYHEDDKEYHFYESERKFIIQAMEEYGKQQRALGFEEGKKEMEEAAKIVTSVYNEKLKKILGVVLEEPPTYEEAKKLTSNSI